MTEFFIKLAANRTFIVTLIAWAIAQTIKVILGVITERKFNFRWFVGTGGMPSSHSAGASALATSVALSYGADSALFAVCLVFAFVAMFDAQSARRAVGRQAEALNKIIADLYKKKGVKQDRLMELIGHTPIQVLVGAAMGIAIALFYHGLVVVK
ncbi:MAG: divergent PAP2 family protein [Candidatus Omnitrophota bacterium]